MPNRAATQLRYKNGRFAPEPKGRSAVWDFLSGARLARLDRSEGRIAAQVGVVPALFREQKAAKQRGAVLETRRWKVRAKVSPRRRRKKR